MKIKDFNKLIKKDNPKHIIFLYTTSQIWLTNKQLDKIIKIKNKACE